MARLEYLLSEGRMEGRKAETTFTPRGVFSRHFACAHMCTRILLILCAVVKSYFSNQFAPKKYLPNRDLD
jgi:hypothetical protein